jgi:malate dehydrogenase (oxaloacetate-decarboxylating)
VYATGRSDYPNQINNVLCYPGIFRGALDAEATSITPNMTLAAADAIADAIADADLSPTNIIPSVFNREVASLVASAVATAAIADGVAPATETAVAPATETAGAPATETAGAPASETKAK